MQQGREILYSSEFTTANTANTTNVANTADISAGSSGYDLKSKRDIRSWESVPLSSFLPQLGKQLEFQNGLQVECAEDV